MTLRYFSLTVTTTTQQRSLNNKLFPYNKVLRPKEKAMQEVRTIRTCYARFEVFTAVAMKNAVFCSLGFCVHHTELQSRPHTSSSLR
jgi:hypothetical protein